MLIQNDKKREDSKKGMMCAGFMFIKASELTRKLFDPAKLDDIPMEGWLEQAYINKLIKNLKYKALPLKLFPNGKYYYKNHKKLNLI